MISGSSELQEGYKNMVESEVKKMTDYQFKAIVIQIIKNVIQEARETNKSQEEIIKEFFEEIKKAV